MELSCFFDDPADVGNLISGSSAFSKTSLNVREFTDHILLKPALEKEMATHSSVLAWIIPGTGEPSGLPSIGLHSRTQLKRLSSSSRCFIDYAKDFDCVDHNKLCKILKEMGIPGHLTCLLRNL